MRYVFCLRYDAAQRVNRANQCHNTLFFLKRKPLSKHRKNFHSK